MGREKVLMFCAELLAFLLEVEATDQVCFQEIDDVWCDFVSAGS